MGGVQRKSDFKLFCVHKKQMAIIILQSPTSYHYIYYQHFSFSLTHLKNTFLQFRSFSCKLEQMCTLMIMNEAAGKFHKDLCYQSNDVNHTNKQSIRNRLPMGTIACINVYDVKRRDLSKRKINTFFVAEMQYYILHIKQMQEELQNMHHKISQSST